MPQPRFWRWLLLFAIVCGGAWSLGLWSRPVRPNLLLITLDTTRADRVGGPAKITPALDKLAAEGIVFERAYTPVPLTLPSHASLLSGRNPPEHGLRLNGSGSRLADDVPVLAETLKQHGYHTGAFIASFVLDSKFGLDRGFDVYDDEIRHPDGETAMDSHRHPSRIGAEVVDSALAWLKLRRRKPFFCWVHLFDPHTPYSARAELFGERFRDQPYDAGVAYADQQVGRLLDYLRGARVDQNTLIVVVGDHGESLGEHQERTHGLTLYNASLHVPLICRFPRPDLSPRKISTAVSLIDLFPTLLAELNVAAPGKSAGRDLRPALRGDAWPDAAIYIETDHPFGEGGWSPLRGIISGDWKYIRSPKPELYDLANDPGELTNLAETRPDELVASERRLAELEAGFERRDAQPITPTSDDQKKLATLGYVGGQEPADVDWKSLPDIKDRIGPYNDYSDATILFLQGKFDPARQLLERTVEAVPDYSQAWLYLGASRLELGEFAAAEDALQRAVEINGNPQARLVLGRHYLSQAHPREAREHLSVAVELLPRSYSGQYLLGEAYRLEGDLDAARQHYQQALDLSPEFAPAQEALKALP